jgi:hypothetical protein
VGPITHPGPPVILKETYPDFPFLLPQADGQEQGGGDRAGPASGQRRPATAVDWLAGIAAAQRVRLHRRCELRWLVASWPRRPAAVAAAIGGRRAPAAMDRGESSASTGEPTRVQGTDWLSSRRPKTAWPRAGPAAAATAWWWCAPVPILVGKTTL